MLWNLLSLLGLLVLLLPGSSTAATQALATGPAASAPPFLALPFVLLLLAIAVLPLAVGHWWEKHASKALVVGLLSVPVVLYSAAQGAAGWARVGHTLGEYVEFMILLGSLYIISGGIVLRGDLRATPLVNGCFLGIGAALASVMGTTGASMLLIRPLLQTNAERHHVAHTIVFFIFLVSNIGGCLTPLGDPPLFLGYLRGVPFTWTLSLWPEWLFMSICLLGLYVAWDSVLYRREAARDLEADRRHIEPLRLHGGSQIWLLGMVLLAVACVPPPWRALLMLMATAASLAIGSKALREANNFTYAPIIEVAVLFLGIFLTMLPALELLRLHGHQLGVDTAAEFFWAAGLLSSFLDNAPTYATFFEAARAQAPESFTGPLVVGIPHVWLEAISLGAVFMGANSYIGNGPNFMVKAVAEEAGVKMPSFFGYMAYSGAILLPLFGLLTLLKF